MELGTHAFRVFFRVLEWLRQAPSVNLIYQSYEPSCTYRIRHIGQ